MIRSVHIARFRSIAEAGLNQCAGLNILIGKNNSGKSNLLAAIELALSHLRRARVVGPWPTRRPQAEFRNRNDQAPVRIGVEFDMGAELGRSLCEHLAVEAPHLDRSIEQITTHHTVSIIIAGDRHKDSGLPFLFAEQLGVGSLAFRDGQLEINGIRLLTISRTAGSELFGMYQVSRRLTSDLETLVELITEGSQARTRVPMDFILQQPKETRARFLPNLAQHVSPPLRRRILDVVSSADSVDEFKRAVDGFADETRRQLEEDARRETDSTPSTFAGEARRMPTYVEWLIGALGSQPYLHIQERKESIGRAEAETLLKLKVTRGGPDRLRTLQGIVRGLLGVSLDAFEAEPGSRGAERAAEIDVDDFLVEANGAGIREALRIVLDLELKRAQLVLIEEPEVHLHPGLARILGTYLRDKSSEVQLFVTTHSSDLVESVAGKSLYFVSRDNFGATRCERVAGDDAALRIPGELGLRRSSLFMFDRLLFVEGQSDEAILRELATTLELDVARHNVAFVWLQGIRNFAAFAAQGTLDILSRRRVRMSFVVDRDEMDDGEIARMIDRLGSNAIVRVLKRRELENYLLDVGALVAWLKVRLQHAGKSNLVDEHLVRQAIEEEAEGLKQEVVRLRLERRMLTPIFLLTRHVPGSVEERSDAGLERLRMRKAQWQDEREKIATEVDAEWATRKVEIVPGSLLLKAVARRFEVTFNKERGDGESLARHIVAGSISRDIKDLLEEVTGT